MSCKVFWKKLFPLSMTFAFGLLIVNWFAEHNIAKIGSTENIISVVENKGLICEPIDDFEIKKYEKLSIKSLRQELEMIISKETDKLVKVYGKNLTPDDLKKKVQVLQILITIKEGKSQKLLYREKCYESDGRK